MRNEYRTSQLRHALAHIAAGRIEAGMGVLSSVIVSMEADEKAATGAGWRHEVIAFANLMEQQLRANDHKPGWKGDFPGDLIRRVEDESAELHVAVDEWMFEDGVARVGKEAADVANFAMMIADVCGALSTAPEAPHTHIRTQDDTPDTGLLAS